MDDHSIKQQPDVSLIMPVYNAEKFLTGSVGSVINQTYSNLELICFNDASTDGSLELLQSFAEADSRVKVIDSKVNVKQGGGRNRALRQAHGHFVMFVDADDALRTDAVERCMAEAERSNADMVVFDYVRTTAGVDSARICQLGDDASSLQGDALRRRIISRTTPVWSAMYERSLITANGLFFPEGVFYEDNAVALAIQLSANNPVKINEALYRYRFDNASVTRSADNYHFFDRLGSATQLLTHLRRLRIYERFADEIDFLFLNQYYVHSIFGCIYRFKRVPLLRLNYIRATVGRHVKDYRRNPYYKAQPIRMKLKIESHSRFPRLVKLLSNLSRAIRRK